MKFAKKCEFCSEYILPDAKVCKHCGREQQSPLPIPAYSNNTGRVIVAWLTVTEVRDARVTDRRDGGEWVKIKLGAPTYRRVWVESRVVSEYMGKPRQGITPLPKRKSN